MKKKYLVFIIFLLINLIPHIYVALSPSGNLLNWYLTDDAFYYFKVAQNISEGRGITFDGLGATNGFHPIWMLVCVPVFALARIDLYLPMRVLIIVLAVLNAGSGYFLYRLFADHLSKKTGWIVAVLWMFLPSIHGITTKLGVESGLNAFALILFFFCVSRLPQYKQGEKIRSTGLLGISLAAMLVLFSRLDNIFILVMVGLWLVFRNSNMRWITQVDFLLILLSSLLSYYLRIQTTDNIFNFLPFAYMLIGFSLVIKPVCLFFFGLYEFNGRITLKRFILKTAAAMTLASILIAAIFFILHDILHLFRGISRSVLILDWLMATVLLVIFRIVIFKRRHNEQGKSLNGLKDNWKIWLGNAAAYFIPLFGMLVVYMLLNKYYTGSPMPVSGQIKRWWGELPNTVYGRPIKTLTGIVSGIFDTSIESGPFWMLTQPLYHISKWLDGVLGISLGSQASTFLLVIVWSIFIAIVLVVSSRRWFAFRQIAERYALLPFFSGCFFHVISYKATGYLHAKYWYWLGEMLLVTVFVGLVLAILIRELEKQSGKAGVAKSAVALVSLALLVNFGYTIMRDFPMDGSAPQLYDYEADFDILEDLTRTGDLIGMTGGGQSSYFMPDRVFVNLDGLINNSQYYESLKAGTVNEYLDSIGLQYIYGEEEVLLGSDPYRWYFTDRLVKIAGKTQFNLYEYCDEVCQ